MNLFCEHFQYRKINKFGEIKIKYKFRLTFYCIHAGALLLCDEWFLRKEFEFKNSFGKEFENFVGK